MTSTCVRRTSPVSSSIDPKFDLFKDGAWTAYSIWGANPSYWLEHCDPGDYPKLMKEARNVITMTLGSELLEVFDNFVNRYESKLPDIGNEIKDFVGELKDIIYTRYKYQLSDDNINHIINLISLSNSDMSNLASLTLNTPTSDISSNTPTSDNPLSSTLPSNTSPSNTPVLNSPTSDNLRDVNFYLNAWKSRIILILEGYTLLNPQGIYSAIVSYCVETKIKIPVSLEDYILSIGTNPESVTTFGILWAQDKLEYFSTFLITILDKPQVLKVISDVIFSSTFDKLYIPSLADFRSKLSVSDPVNSALRLLIYNIWGEIYFVKRYSILDPLSFKYKNIETNFRLIIKQSTTEVNSPSNTMLIDIEWLYLKQKNRLIHFRNELYETLGISKSDFSIDLSLEEVMKRFASIPSNVSPINEHKGFVPSNLQGTSGQTIPGFENFSEFPSLTGSYRSLPGFENSYRSLPGLNTQQT